MSSPRRPRDTVSWCPDCGYRSPVTTRGLAAHGLRLHTCERQRRKQQTAANAAALRARRGTVIRDCPHGGNHQHGTGPAYVMDRCRCNACTDNRTAYEARRRRQTAYGRWRPYIDAEPARQHVRALMAQGMGWQRIARTAGVNNSMVAKLLYGATDRGMAPSKRIRPEHADRILAVELDLADAALADAHGTWLRLQALVAIGWPKAHLAAALGRGRALQFRRGMILVSTAAQVRDLYEQRWNTPGPSERARRYAAARGWATPLELDDDHIDDPDYTPRLHRLDQVAERRQQREDVAERRAQVHALTADGLTTAEIARLLSVTTDIVAADRKRAVRQAS